MRLRTFPMIAKTMSGLEDVLAEELVAMGADNLQIGKRMVSFEGDLALLYRANLHCRTALRILCPILEFRARTTDDIYKHIKAFNWFDYINEENTIAIDAVVFSDLFTHSQFVAYRVKDAIVDYFISKTEKRPSIDKDNPDLRINFHVAHDQCTLSIDSSGDSLHKRGYRIQQTEAPLNEVLAAGMIMKTGWKGECDLIDPMCGSGTILIEAAMIAMNVPPGIYRKNFAFEKWKNFNRDLFDNLYNDDSGERPLTCKLYGSDILPDAINIARENCKSAGFEKYISLQVMPFEKYIDAPSENGIIITNPPYGERIKIDDLLGLYERLGERLKHIFTGYIAWVLSYRKECFDKIGLKPSKKINLVNGSLECQFRQYNLFKGRRNEQ